MAKFNDGEFDADNLTKQFDLQSGRRRINVAVGSGYDVDEVYLIDIHRRARGLFPITRETLERFAPGLLGGAEPAVHLYGLPVYYWVSPRREDGTGGMQLYMWPVPLHPWRLRVTYKLSAVGERLKEMAAR